MPTPPPWRWATWGDEGLRTRAEGTVGIADALNVARSLIDLGSALGTSSWDVLSAMATLGSLDLSLARVVEPHMDNPDTTVAESVIVAARTRAIVAHVAGQVMTTVGHALGPAPLAFDQAHATRVADLTLYLRQHHGERDLTHLGSLVLDGSP